MIHHPLTITLIAFISGFFMSCGIGANDVANTMGTSVGSKVLSIRQALFIAAIFEAAGAFLASGHVTETIRSGIIDMHVLSTTPDLFVFGMLASLLSAGTWLALATYFGWPVSTTHSIVGAVIGFGAIIMGWASVQWHMVITIFLSWTVTPIIGGVAAFLLFKSIHWFILDRRHPVKETRRFLPVYVFVVAFVMGFVTLVNGSSHVHFGVAADHKLLCSGCIGLLFMVFSHCLLKRVLPSSEASGPHTYAHIEKGFGILAVLTACSLGFAHGSNDVANAIGPLEAIIEAVHPTELPANLPSWIPFLGATGLVIGLVLYGHRVIETIGKNITLLTPSRAFAAQLATAATIVVSSGLGLPVSTTQTLVGAVLGVGFAGGINALNLSVVRNIFMSWVITLPIGAFLAIIFFYVLRVLFSG